MLDDPFLQGLAFLFELGPAPALRGEDFHPLFGAAQLAACLVFVLAQAEQLALRFIEIWGFRFRSFQACAGGFIIMIQGLDLRLAILDLNIQVGNLAVDLFADFACRLQIAEILFDAAQLIFLFTKLVMFRGVITEFGKLFIEFCKFFLFLRSILFIFQHLLHVSKALSAG